MICVLHTGSFSKKFRKRNAAQLRPCLYKPELFTFDALQCHNSNSGQCLDEDPFADPFAWLRICICRVNPFPPSSTELVKKM